MSDKSLSDPGEQVKKFSLLDDKSTNSFFSSAFDCFVHHNKDTALDDFEDFVTRLGVYMHLKTVDYDLTPTLRDLAALFISEVKEND